MTLTEAAINVPERASQIGDEIWANPDRLSERAGDAITPELLMMAANSAPHYLIGFVFMRNLHAAVEAYARQRADDEDAGLVERLRSEPRTATFVKNLGPETYIFPADEDGRALSMLEMSGSFKGALDHAQALANAGYLIAPQLPDCDGCRVNLAGEVECCQEKP